MSHALFRLGLAPAALLLGILACNLYIEVKNVRDRATGACIQVSAVDWARITQQLSAYHLQYDAQACTLTSDRLPILTLDQLADPAP